jgi:hypothetical protein
MIFAVSIFFPCSNLVGLLMAEVGLYGLGHLTTLLKSGKFAQEGTPNTCVLHGRGEAEKEIVLRPVYKRDSA